MFIKFNIKHSILITLQYLFLFRYQEGNGSTALFKEVRSVEFITTNEIVVVDRTNFCLRTIDLLTIPTTSTFAGNCTIKGNADGDRLTNALFNNPYDLEFDNSNQKLYALEYSKRRLKVIHLTTGIMETVHRWSTTTYSIRLRGFNEIYRTYRHGVSSLDLTTKMETDILGSSDAGTAIGSFNITRLNSLEYITSPSVDNRIWFIADKNNDRYFNLYFLINIFIIKQT